MTPLHESRILSDAQLKEIEARAENATVDPAEADDGNICGVCHAFVNVRTDSSDFHDDPICDHCLGEFAIHARTDIPLLIQSHRELEKTATHVEWCRAEVVRERSKRMVETANLEQERDRAEDERKAYLQSRDEALAENSRLSALLDEAEKVFDSLVDGEYCLSSDCNCGRGLKRLALDALCAIRAGRKP